MFYVAFTLGLFGSLHCVGMCGPLAIAFSHSPSPTRRSKILAGLSYNLGRATTYALLGLFFGAIGTAFYLTDMQKSLSIILGVLLVVSFLFSIDLDHKISNTWLLKKTYTRVHSVLNTIMSKARNYHPYYLGIMNGLLPCGLVYLAIAGALATGNIFGGALFMFIFGLGTLPMLLVLSLGTDLLPQRWRMRFRRILPFVTLAFGLFLIYRGIYVDMPTNLDFWTALKNPIMCH